MKRKTILFLSGIMAIVIMGCYNDNRTVIYPTPDTGDSCYTATVTFAANIKPILDASCATAGCHDADFQSGGYDMTTYAGFMNAVNSNKLLGSIKHLSGYVAMPQSMAKLSDCQISQIEAWINAGAQNN